MFKGNNSKRTDFFLKNKHINITGIDLVFPLFALSLMNFICKIHKLYRLEI